VTQRAPKTVAAVDAVEAFRNHRMVKALAVKCPRLKGGLPEPLRAVFQEEVRDHGHLYRHVISHLGRRMAVSRILPRGQDSYDPHTVRASTRESLLKYFWRRLGAA